MRARAGCDPAQTAAPQVWSVALNAARKEMLDAVRERSKGKKGRGGEEAIGAGEFEALDLASFVMAREDAFAELCEGFGGDGGAGGALRGFVGATVAKRAE